MVAKSKISGSNLWAIDVESSPTPVGIEMEMQRNVLWVLCTHYSSTTTDMRRKVSLIFYRNRKDQSRPLEIIE